MSQPFRQFDQNTTEDETEAVVGSREDPVGGVATAAFGLLHPQCLSDLVVRQGTRRRLCDGTDSISKKETGHERNGRRCNEAKKHKKARALE